MLLLLYASGEGEAFTLGQDVWAAGRRTANTFGNEEDSGKRRVYPGSIFLRRCRPSTSVK